MEDRATKFWMVWRSGSATTRYQHKSKQSAQAEAERLSAQNPCEIFYVLKAVSAVTADKPIVRNVKLVREPDEIPF